MTTLPPKRRSAKKKVWPYVVLGTILIFVLAALAGVFFAQSSLLDRAKDEQKDELLTAKDKATIMIPRMAKMLPGPLNKAVSNKPVATAPNIAITVG